MAAAEQVLQADPLIMAGLVPAIFFASAEKDARVKPAHDDVVPHSSPSPGLAGRSFLNAAEKDTPVKPGQGERSLRQSDVNPKLDAGRSR